MNRTEYEEATTRREAEGARALLEFMPDEQAWERVRAGTALYLPDGPDTEGHHLLVAENSAGQVVGSAWVGPDPREASGTTDSAWLYDIDIAASFRRRGYGSAVLAALEDFVSGAGFRRLALNVVGGNTAAIALYSRNGYEISSMFLDKKLPAPRS